MWVAASSGCFATTCPGTHGGVGNRRARILCTPSPYATAVPSFEDLESDRKAIRKLVLAAAYAANKGHIGSALSIVDILLAADAALGSYYSPDRKSNLVLSKGHAASALYALMVLRGQLSVEDLHTYCQDGSILGTHPSVDLPGVTFASGSLGQGLGVGVGLALADRMGISDRRTLCLLSDAELNEGSTWEALLVASHHALSNLVVAVDVNGQQALGRTQDVLKTEGFAEAAAALGWQAVVVDGHNVAAMVAELTQPTDGRPLLLLCETVAGSGVSFMEQRIEWHYFPMDSDQYAEALSDVASGQHL